MDMAECDNCGANRANFTLEECEDCETRYCEDCVDNFSECNGCGGHLCDEHGKFWRNEEYCDDCYVFPHGDED